ncbi:hypothetical protein EYF80_036161 [Liparis tanakae]|uniref:Uncharacterized protein n=1 Tax=Liparis tanakae TaxID=230148 RepID=A0A4Z2GJA5_9TELE|nr:hypothetical protein EYF80_036161 [Liparis tanakae]
MELNCYSRSSGRSAEASWGSQLLWKVLCSCDRHAALPLAWFQLSTPLLSRSDPAIRTIAITRSLPTERSLRVGGRLGGKA